MARKVKAARTAAVASGRGAAFKARRISGLQR